MKKGVCYHLRLRIIRACRSQHIEEPILSYFHFIDIRAEIDFLFAALSLLGHFDLRLCQKFLHTAFPVNRRLFARTELHKIICCCHQCHRFTRFSILYLADTYDMHPLCHLFLQTGCDLCSRHIFCHFQVKIISETLHPYSKGNCKRHDHMRAVSAGKSYRKFRPTKCFLEITHGIQMSHKLHRTLFAEFNSYLQGRHLL